MIRSMMMIGFIIVRRGVVIGCKVIWVLVRCLMILRY